MHVQQLIPAGQKKTADYNAVLKMSYLASMIPTMGLKVYIQYVPSERPRWSLQYCHPSKRKRDTQMLAGGVFFGIALGLIENR